MTTYYFLADYSDEIMPCAPTPEAWAQWLSAGDPNWDDGVQPAKPGATFKANSLTLVGHVRPLRGEDGVWRLPDGAPEADFAALVSDETDETWTAEVILSPRYLSESIDELRGDEFFDDADVCLILGRTSGPLLATYHGPDQPVTFAEVTEH